MMPHNPSWSTKDDKLAKTIAQVKATRIRPDWETDAGNTSGHCVTLNGEKSREVTYMSHFLGTELMWTGFGT